MKLDKDIEDLLKKLERIVMEKQIISENDNKEKEQKGKAEDQARYQSMKKQIDLHDESLYLCNTQDKTNFSIVYVGGRCTSERCVIECPFFPPNGYVTKEGIFYYDDPNLMPGFYGTNNALDARRKLAAELKMEAK